MLTLELACNQDNSGIFMGAFDALILNDRDGERLIEMDGPEIRLDYERPSTLTKCKFSRLLLGKLKINFFGMREWIGNWCWNSYSISEDNAVKVINYLLKHRWSPTEAGEDLYKKMETAKFITLEDLKHEP